ARGPAGPVLRLGLRRLLRFHLPLLPAGAAPLQAGATEARLRPRTLQELVAPRLSVRRRLLSDQPLLQGRRPHPPALQALPGGGLVPVRVQALRVPAVLAPGDPDGGLPAARRLPPGIPGPAVRRLRPLLQGPASA